MASALFSINRESLATSLGVARKELELAGVKTKDLSSLEVITYRMAWDALRRGEQTLEKQALLLEQMAAGRVKTGSYIVSSGQARPGIASVLPASHSLTVFFKQVRAGLIFVFGETYTGVFSEKDINLAWAIKNDPRYHSSHTKLKEIENFVAGCVLGGPFPDQQNASDLSLFARVSILSINQESLERLVAQAKERLNHDGIATEGLTSLDVKIHYLAHAVFFAKQEEWFRTTQRNLFRSGKQAMGEGVGSMLSKMHVNRPLLIQKIAGECKKRLTKDEIDFVFVTEWNKRGVSVLEKESSFADNMFRGLENFWLKTGGAQRAAASRK